MKRFLTSWSSRWVGSEKEGRDTGIMGGDGLEERVEGMEVTGRKRGANRKLGNHTQGRRLHVLRIHMALSVDTITNRCSAYSQFHLNKPITRGNYCKLRMDLPVMTYQSSLLRGTVHYRESSLCFPLWSHG